MKATIVDLRYRMHDVLRALERNEDVIILYRGKEKGVIRASADRSTVKVRSHPFFGMRADGGSVADKMAELRGGRHSAL